jgi:hypothetical protein
MTAFVLVLAGVTAGDGGTGTGAATAPLTEPLRLDFSQDWEGTVHRAPDDDAEPVRLSKGQMTFSNFGVPVTMPFALTLSPGGLALASCGEDRLHGTYKVQGDRLLVCVLPVGEPCPTACTPSDGVLLTLKPAARKP